MPDTPPTKWVPNRSPATPPWPQPPIWLAMLRGARGLCPACGRTAAFAGWLRVRPACTVCTAPLGDVRADDAPPYFVIFAVGHVVVGCMFLTDRLVALSAWTEAAIFLPFALVLALGLLRPVKGAVLGLMLRLGLVVTRADGNPPGAAPRRAADVA
jgi:uncharacterized protein (DUF983 family)